MASGTGDDPIQQQQTQITETDQPRVSVAHIAARAAFHAAMISSDGLGRSDTARAWLSIGIGLRRRPTTHAARFFAEGVVAGESGDLATAVSAHEQLWKLTLHANGPRQPGRGDVRAAVRRR